MEIDPDYCMSSYLMYRMIVSNDKCFKEGFMPKLANIDFPRYSVKNSEDLYDALKRIVDDATKDGKAALALSGGIDSAILASMMPKGSTAYTFKCVVPGVQVIDETQIAKEVADKFGLNHKVIEVYWDDIQDSLIPLMKNKGAPFHSIESQIYKACIQCKKDGFSKLIFGENADIIYGGMDGLLKKDWTFGEYVERYSYVLPYKVLKNPKLVLEPYWKYEYNGYVDSYSFTNEYFRKEALGTYNNACEAAGIQFIGPFSQTRLDIPIDLERIRSGDSKYIVREVYRKVFNTTSMPQKTPMPRPTNEWMKNWEGPKRSEFIKNSIQELNGDQRWMVYCLEKFLDYIDKD